MKHIYTLLLMMLALAGNIHAQGWPKDYKGVMLQGFYWDSYQDTQWSHLENQADELSKYFSLIWVPQSGYCNTLQNQMGYAPIWWFRHDSAFGSETELRKMIKTFKDKGTGIIEDVVINHRNGNTNWCDFPEETWKGQTMHWSLADICQNDDGGNTKRNGYTLKGNSDTGDDFDGARDIDNTSPNAQKNIKAYLDFLLNDLGYTGFRYDMVKGFAPNYIGMYNTSAKPMYSVGEYWDKTGNIKNWIDGTKVEGVPTSAAFDFDLKYRIFEAFSSNGDWSKLNGDCLVKDSYYKQYAVTFVDNHDTGRTDGQGSNPLFANIEAANAYILAMPGTPCVFLPHWLQYKTAIKRMIATRRAVGISNTSDILQADAKHDGFVLKVKGSQGDLLLILGTTTDANTQGMKLATSGDNYKMYVSNAVNIDKVKSIKEEKSTFHAPSFCVVNDGETCAFFEKPKDWSSDIKCWAWNDTGNFTGGTWPGVACTKVGVTDSGNEVWKWTWNGSFTKGSAEGQVPTYIIFNAPGPKQTNDLKFQNGAYYNPTGVNLGVVTDIKKCVAQTSKTTSVKIYTLQGCEVGTTNNVQRALQQLPKGVYLINHQKIVVP
ncbi:alpha-amylase family glycosyl hydrolase [Hoylesella timonensis]|uniref:alpha-amylase family glycosyl hydrolase n=1 Tax=Hoylesella timonensis TaxID=386414 RepID=UPI00040B884B|nr:alpha-amylase family glycosyl hydrolase [Hoylesella timonensis]